jgi:beta-ureidopropionase / N-carbamoyl-L-amino-acid hydrolase
VAEQVEFTLDLRHADSDKVEEMERAFREALQAAADASGVRSFVEVLADSPPAPFSKDIVAAVEENARSLGLSRMQMPSGAGHDACNISRRYPTGMIFVQSVGGLSHNEAEFTPQSDCTAGVRVLAMTATSLASGGK